MPLIVPESIQGPPGRISWDFAATIEPGRMGNTILIRLPSNSQATITEVTATITAGPGDQPSPVEVLYPSVQEALLDFMGEPSVESQVQGNVVARFPDPGTFPVLHDLQGMSAVEPFEALPPEQAIAQVEILSVKREITPALIAGGISLGLGALTLLAGRRKE